MKLTSYTFSELRGSDREWAVGEFTVEGINLLVGQNASGKSRILNSVRALSILLSSAPPKIFASGEWSAQFEDKQDKYQFDLTLENRLISHERLAVNGKVLLERDSDGNGSIWNNQVSDLLQFQIDQSSVASFFKRDSKQHPFLAPLYKWGSALRYYPFGTDFGKSVIFAAPMSGTDDSPSESPQRSSSEPQNVVGLYVQGYERFGDRFDKEILSDFRAAGYDCVTIDAVNAEQYFDEIPAITGNRVPVSLEVRERGLACPTRQFDMSMGMYRTLALLIHLNYMRLSKIETTILIDDIGEGLDFDRSTSLIKRLIRKSGRDIQLIMSTNDRFVMNEVDLDYWHVVSRKYNKVSIFDYKNSRKIFERFKYLGLSNFDFFAKKAYLN